MPNFPAIWRLLYIYSKYLKFKLQPTCTWSFVNLGYPQIAQRTLFYLRICNRQGRYHQQRSIVVHRSMPWSFQGRASNQQDETSLKKTKWKYRFVWEASSKWVPTYSCSRESGDDHSYIMCKSGAFHFRLH